jgi:hypothetical protein
MLDASRECSRIFWLLAGRRAAARVDVALGDALALAASWPVPPLDTSEATELLCDPLRRGPQLEAFPVSFWGHTGVEAIRMKSGGHPAVLQLLARHAVRLTFEAHRCSLRDDAVDAATAALLVDDKARLDALFQRQELLPEQRVLLSKLDRARGELTPDEVQACAPLIERGLVARGSGESYDLAVPLTAEWLRTARRTTRRTKARRREPA